MQKKIFEDQASMHEAYLDGGLPEIERLYKAGIIDLTTREAWQQVDLGRKNGTGKRSTTAAACCSGASSATSSIAST